MFVIQYFIEWTNAKINKWFQIIYLMIILKVDDYMILLELIREIFN